MSTHIGSNLKETHQVSIDKNDAPPVSEDIESSGSGASINDPTVPKCFLVIENVFRYHSALRVGLGSLFLTGTGLYFIEYSEHLLDAFQRGGSLSSGAIRDAVNSAKSRKQEEWGLPIEEIYKRHEQSSLVPRHELVRIDFYTEPQNWKIAVHLLDGNTVYFFRMDSLSYGRPYVGDKEHDLDRYAQELIAYGQGLDVLNPEHWKRYGLSIDLPAPLIFVESILSSRFHSVFSNEMLPRITGDAKYMDTLFSLVNNNQNPKNQRDLLNFIPELPEFFRAEFKTRLRAELPGQDRLIVGCTSVVVVGCIIFGVIAVMNFSTPLEEWPTWTSFIALFGLLLIVMGLYGAITERTKRNRYSELIEK
jgi:hypothetical protein